MKTKEVIQVNFNALPELHDLHAELVKAKLAGHIEKGHRRELEKLTHDFLRALNAAPVEEIPIK